jgi:hypothetical protein
MESEFIPYTEALALKELGFDEPCFGFYYLYKDENHQEGKFDYRGELNIEYSIYKENTYYILAPTFSQAFRFFREKYNLHSFIDCKWKNLGWEFQLVDLSKMETISSIDRYNYKTYEEAELECLKKLIEIVKEKQL